MAQINWLNDTSGDFSNAADWSGGVVPGPSDDVSLGALAGTPYTVSVKSDEEIASLVTAANSTLTIGGFATFQVDNTSGMTSNAGTIIASADLATEGSWRNTGLISIGQAGSLLLNGDLTLSGGGAVKMDYGYVGERNFETPEHDFVNVDNTMTGSMFIVVKDFVNETHGVLNDNYDGNIAAQYTITNDGVINFVGSGDHFDLEGERLDQTGGGTIYAGAKATIYLVGQSYTSTPIDIAGGTLKSAATGLFYIYAGILDGTAAPLTIEGAVTTATGGSYLPNEDVILEGAIDNLGAITDNPSRLNSKTTNFPQLQVSGGATLTGAGQIVLGQYGGLVATGDAASLDNVGNTITGVGQIGGGALSLSNESAGVIEASGARGQSLVVDIGTASLANGGLIEANSAARLYLEDGSASNTGQITATGAGGLFLNNLVLDQSGGGTLEVSTRVYLQGATIRGGLIQRTGSGVVVAQSEIDVLDGSSSPVVNEARIDLDAGAELMLVGSIVNSGGVSLIEPGAGTLTIGEAGATLSGGGIILLGDNLAHVVEGASAAATLTNVDNRIDGAGLLGNGQLDLVNEAAGVIECTYAKGLVIDTGSNTITNAGVISAIGAGLVTIESAIINDGHLQTHGGTLIAEGAVSGSGLAVIHNGVLDFENAFEERAQFLGGGTLRLAQSQAYTGAVFGFAASGKTALDLTDIGFVGAGEASYSGTAAKGVLTVTDGTHTARIHLVGDYLNATFTAASDGQGGTVITAGAAPGARAPSPALAAMHADQGVRAALATAHGFAAAAAAVTAGSAAESRTAIETRAPSTGLGLARPALA